MSFEILNYDGSQNDSIIAKGNFKIIWEKDNYIPGSKEYSINATDPTWNDILNNENASYKFTLKEDEDVYLETIYVDTDKNIITLEYGS